LIKTGLGDLAESFVTPPPLFIALSYSLASSILIYLLYSIILLNVSINLPWKCLNLKSTTSTLRPGFSNALLSLNEN